MSYENLKIGKLVQTVLRPLIISKATAYEVMQMQELEYSKATFGIQYPLLLKTSAPTAEKHYYSELLTINGESYRLCCEWFEKDSNNDRPYVEKWIREHEEEAGGLLTGVLEALDPVAFHSEYYSGNYVGSMNNTAVNGKWLFCWNDNPYIMDENGENKVELDLDEEWKNSVQGMNNKGVWFMPCHPSDRAWNDAKWYNKLICFNPETNKKRIIEFNSCRADIRQIYIYEDIIYYVGSVSENSEMLVKVDCFGTETVLHRVHSGVKISKISADSERVVFYISVDVGYNSWCIKDTYGNDQISIERLEDSDSFWGYIEAELIDLKHNIMWTPLTGAERNAYGAREGDLIAREIGKLVEFKFLDPYDESKPIIFSSPLSLDMNKMHIKKYFDGKDMYCMESSRKMLRFDGNGSKYMINIPLKHGGREKFLVNDTYIFINYDAEDTVRLPRRFSTTEVCGRDNPEATLIFGDDYVL